MEWKDIPGYEGKYQASSCGQIKSKQRAVWAGTHYSVRKERLLKQYEIKGYMTVRLYDGHGNAKTIGVHRLVAWAFIGEQKRGLVCCHNDGNPMNNRHDNLRYDTVTGNAHDKYKHGTHSIGSRNANAKLTEEDVRFIRYEDHGMTLRELSVMFGITRNAVYWAKAGITWSHLTEEE